MAVEQALLDGIALMKEGKEEGFNIFYSYTYNYVYGRARMIMKNEEDALDLTQETFLQAYKGISSLADPNTVYGWLRTITFHQGYKIHNKHKHETLVTEDAESIFDDIASTDMSSSPEDSTDAKETANIVMGMLDELSDDQKLAIVAHYYDGLKIEEIAKLCNCSANTIKSRLRYAKEALREKVTAHEKQNRYKLCSLTPAVLFMASEALLTTEKYTLTATGANAAYAALCSALGFTPTALAAKAAAASSSATAVAGTLTTGAAKGGLSLLAKIVIVSLATTGTIAATILLSDTEEAPYADEMSALIQKVETRLEQNNQLETNVYDIETSVLGAFTKTEDANVIAAAESIISEIITPGMSEPEKVKAIHDYMVMNLDFDCVNVQSGTIPETSYTAEGVLSTKYGVSAGYAKTFELLCDCADIETEYIVGTTSEGLHVWNQVKIDESWYHIDVTSNDPYTEGKTFDFHLDNRYSYFLLSDKDILYGETAKLEHYPLNQQYTCNAASVGNTAFDYFCPWLENNPDINYATSDEEVEVIMLEALENGVAEFTLFLRNDQYNEDDINRFVNANSALGGYWYTKMIWTNEKLHADDFFTNWTFSIDLTQKQWPILSTEEEIKECIKSYGQSLTDQPMDVYFTSTSFDFEASMSGHFIMVIMLLPAVQAIVWSMNAIPEPFML